MILVIEAAAWKAVAKDGVKEVKAFGSGSNYLPTVNKPLETRLPDERCIKYPDLVDGAPQTLVEFASHLLRVTKIGPDGTASAWRRP